MGYRGRSGQSAIEYLMTYGWMLLVVAVVGGAIFSTVNQQGVESTSGFTGEDVMVVDQFGANSYGELEMVLRNGGAEEIELNEVRVIDGESTAVWKPAEERRELDVSGTQVATFLQVEEGGETSSLDIELNYNMGDLENLESQGTITGNFQIIEGSEYYDMDPFVLHVNSTRPGNTNDTQFEIGTGSGNINYQVEWESLEDSSEGEIINPLTGDHTLNFDSPGMHQIEIRGLYPHPVMNSGGDESKVESLEAWGDIDFTSMDNSFRDTNAMTANYNDVPNLSRVEDMGAAFRGSKFNGTAKKWDISNVKYMEHMFHKADNFDGNLSQWDTSNVENLDSTFFNADSFNSDLGDWNTGNVQNMYSLYKSASNYDQNISSWCVEQINSEPGSFDDGAAFEGEDSKQPNWGQTC